MKRSGVGPRGRFARLLPSGDLWNETEAIDQVVQDALTRPMIGLSVFMDSLELRTSFGTTVYVSFCGDPLQSGALGDRDTGAVFANGVNGKALKLRLH